MLIITSKTRNKTAATTAETFDSARGVLSTLHRQHHLFVIRLLIVSHSWHMRSLRVFPCFPTFFFPTAVPAPTVDESINSSKPVALSLGTCNANPAIVSNPLSAPRNLLSGASNCKHGTGGIGSQEQGPILCRGEHVRLGTGHVRLGCHVIRDPPSLQTILARSYTVQVHRS